MINSHVQIPRSILKGFSLVESIKNNGLFEKHDYVYFLNMKGKIEKSDIKDCNTKLGYFEKEVENNILKTREDYIGRIKKKINNIEKGDIKLTIEDNEKIKEFLILTLLRSPEVVRSYCNKSVTCLLSPNLPQNQLLYAYESLKSKFINYIFKNYNINVFINRSKTNFIIPQICFYEIIVSEKSKMFVFPISPKIAVTLNNDIMKYMSDDGFLHCQVTEDNEIIHRFNKTAIATEYNFNKQNIYSRDKIDLEQYLIFFEQLKNKDKKFNV